MLKIFRKRLLSWYNEHKRPLPWRSTKDPYKIWLSEVLLQQTRVAQGTPYYFAFIEKYPTVADLANAPEDDVLRLWQGLGYYSRARNVLKCAKIVALEMGGVFPSSSALLEKLPGIGPYTAAAIASIAFGEPVPVVDGNVYRVLSRVFDIDVDIGSAGAYRVFYEKAEKLLPKKEASLFNQALMEFGALYCTPRGADCTRCVMQDICQAKALGIVDKRPVKEKKMNVRQRSFNYFLFEFENKVLIRKRGPKDIWEGLYEYYNIEGQFDVEELKQILTKYLQINDLQSLYLNEISPIYRHTLTHQQLFIRIFTIRVVDETLWDYIKTKLELIEIVKSDFSSYGKPIILQKYLTI